MLHSLFLGSPAYMRPTLAKPALPETVSTNEETCIATHCASNQYGRFEFAHAIALTTTERVQMQLKDRSTLLRSDAEALHHEHTQSNA